jgi:cell division protein FtsA
MSRTKDVAILDIGSKKMTVLIGENNFKGVYSVKGVGECDYEGFAAGEWLNVEGVRVAVARAVSSAEAEAGVKIKKLFIGVPSEFLAVVCKPVYSTYSKPIRISEIEVNGLYEKGNDFNDKNFVDINSSAIYFTLDDQPRRLIEPRGVFAQKLSAMVSYILCETAFVKLFDGIAADLKLKEVEYVSSMWAEAMGMLEPEQRDKYAVIMDIGYISSSVALIRGDGLLHLSSFSVGGGHISADICTVLDIPFTVAETIKEKIDLNLAFSGDDFYEAEEDGEIYRLDAQKVHEIVVARLDDIIDYIKKSVEICKNDCPPFVQIYLTGGGVTSLRGAKEYISSSLNKQIEILSPTVPRFGKPYFCSSIGLLDVATKLNSDGGGGFIKKLIAKIGG